MKILHALWAGFLMESAIVHVSAATLYVSLNSTNPVPPYAGWPTAATNIQDAVDASTNGDLILVTNGVYKTVESVAPDGRQTVAVVNDAVTLQSVNGPGLTIINGTGWRCVYLTNNSALIGFTVTNGGAVMGGGVLCASAEALVSNCWLIGNSSPQGGGAYNGTLRNCNLTGNHSSFQGAGAANAVLYDCVLTGNSAGDGGGTEGCTVSNCTMTGNSASYGGGAYGGILVNCTFSGNSAGRGGAVYGNNPPLNAYLNDCIISNNSATYGGGAAGFRVVNSQTGQLINNDCVLSNCTLVGNFASVFGGGAADCTLNACIVNENSVSNSSLQAAGGGVEESVLIDCVLTSNSVLSTGTSPYGGGADSSVLNRCRLLRNSVSNGGPGSFGGGAANSFGTPYAGCLNNCVLVGNYSSGPGGGADGCMLSNCLVYANQAFLGGGGADGGELINCTIVSNSVNVGYLSAGGAYSSAAENCIIYYNLVANSLTATNSNYASGGGPPAIGYSCTTPLPTNTVGNITNQPVFVNPVGGNFRLQTNSPCINAGNNAYVSGPADLDGRPRIVGSTVDMGAYEFQGPGMGEFIAWLQQFGLPTDGTADYVDSDHDGLNNYLEWIAGTNPTNTSSVLAMLPPVPTNNPAGLVLGWQSVNNRTYFLQTSTNLGAQPAFSTIQSNIVGQSSTTSYMDTSATNVGPYLYRVGVQQ